jgi:hypothetical protein
VHILRHVSRRPSFQNVSQMPLLSWSLAVTIEAATTLTTHTASVEITSCDTKALLELRAEGRACDVPSCRLWGTPRIQPAASGQPSPRMLLAMSLTSDCRSRSPPYLDLSFAYHVGHSSSPKSGPGDGPPNRGLGTDLGFKISTT